MILEKELPIVKNHIDKKRMVEHHGLFVEHPIVGAIVTFVGVLVGHLLPLFISLHWQVPIICMQLVQLIVWGATLVVAGITIHGWYKKNFGKKGIEDFKNKN